MSERNAKMLRKMKANDKKSKRAWKALTHIQRSNVRAEYDRLNPDEAVIAFAKEVVFRP